MSAAHQWSCQPDHVGPLLLCQKVYEKRKVTAARLQHDGETILVRALWKPSGTHCESKIHGDEGRPAQTCTHEWRGEHVSRIFCMSQLKQKPSCSLQEHLHGTRSQLTAGCAPAQAPAPPVSPFCFLHLSMAFAPFSVGASGQRDISRA